MGARSARLMRAVALAPLAAALTLGACGKPAGSSAPPASAAPPVAAAPSATPAAPAGADAAAVQAFLEGLYAHYKSQKTVGAAAGFEPFDANAADVFDPDMLALLKADVKANNGGVGVMDSDWLCNCQDFVSIHANIAVQSATATTAKATAELSDSGMPDDKPTHNAFELVKVNGAWRIHDIIADSSLRQALQEEIKTLSTPAGKKAAAGDEAP